MSDGTKVDLECAPNACTRCCCLEESCFVGTYTNAGAGPGYVALTPNFPAKVIQYPTSDGELIVKRRGYMSSLGDVNVDMDCDWRCIPCCCGHLGLIRQKISGGADATAFLNAGGTVLVKELQAGEQVM